MYAPEPIQMTEAAYLEFEASSEEKYEYSQGYVYAMTGGSVRHGIIAVNVATQLNIQLADRDCTVINSDVRVYVDSKQSYRYPDVTVFCGDPAYVSGRMDTINNPILLIEVLSPSTELIDRNEKLAEYIQIETLQAYLLISQNEAKVERFMRHESGEWLYRIARGMTESVALPGLGCTLSLAMLYQKITFDEA